MARQSPQMFRRTIPLVREETIFGKHVMVRRHETIPCDFGDDGGSRNREGEGVSFDNGPDRDPDSWKDQGIDEKVIGEGTS